MSSRFYDVVVLGTRIGALASAALLARRDFRVLVLGHGALPSTYRFDGLPLRRRTFAHLAAPTPAWRRVVAELAQSQAFKRRLRPLDPMLQLLDGKRRLELAPDPVLFARELERELADARGAIEELYARLARLNAQIDDVFEQDALWPPGTFWERRETGRLRDALPLLADPRARRGESLTVDADYRAAFELPAQFASHARLDPLDDAALLPLARLHGAWTRGVAELPGDEDELSAFLMERIRAHGGDVRPQEWCEAILHKRGKVAGVIVEGDTEITGASFVIGDRPIVKLLDVVRDLEEARIDEVSAPPVAARRFAVSVVVRQALVPQALARHAFLRPARANGVDVHLHRATFPQSAALGPAGTDPALAALSAELWVAEALLPEGVAPPQGSTGRDMHARELVLATLRDHFPYFDRHALIIDSPHDGAPLLDLRHGDTVLVGRSATRFGGGHLEAEGSDAIYDGVTGGYAGLALEPIRTPIEHLLQVSPTVLPALGQEGELIAAWGAARIVTRSDRQKEKMRREMWSKIEI
jgi:phytoene dehydrogenase-like protein